MCLLKMSRSLSFAERCPETSRDWSDRARVKCTRTDQYHCVEDEFSKTVEVCLNPIWTDTGIYLYICKYFQYLSRKHLHSGWLVKWQLIWLKRITKWKKLLLNIVKTVILDAIFRQFLTILSYLFIYFKDYYTRDKIMQENIYVDWLH